LVAHAAQQQELNMIDQRELYDAIIAGAKASKYGRDLEHPDGDLSVFSPTFVTQAQLLS
jgi:hypothetical protein